MANQRVLMVDDSAASRMIIKRCFEIAGYGDSEYYEAEDGLKALSFLQENKVDLILSDLKMPKIDGYTLIRKQRMSVATKNIPVAVATSLRDDVTDKNNHPQPLSPEKVFDAMEGNR